jgi:ABC-2 type transport system permease protein
MKRYLHLYKTYFTFALVNSMAYPADFITWSVIDTMWAVVNIGFFKVLLLNIPDIHGWTFSQLVIPLGIYSLLNAFIWGVFYGNMKELSKSINRGTLDLVLTKPVSSQFIVSVRSISFNLFPSVLIGVFLLGYGFIINHLHPINLVFLPLILISSVLIFYSLYFFSTTLTFWTNRLQNISEFMPQIADAARYPTDIFPVAVRFILTYIIPLGLLAIFPAKILLSSYSPAFILIPLFIGVFLLYFSHLFWHFALRFYSSASS